jgi:glycosyltransferase involved in cell wall biosynthesis
MAKLLMISGDRALAEGKHGAFYNTLEEFHKYWDRIDVICPKVKEQKVKEIFGNVFIYPSPWPLICQKWWVFLKGSKLFKRNKFDLMTVHEYPPFYNGIGAWMLWRKIKVPYVLEVMHIPGYPKAGNFKEVIYKNLIRWFLRYDTKRARGVRIINKEQTPQFLKKSGVPEGKFIHIPAFYIDLDTFSPKNEEKKYDIVFAARLEKNKGILELIKAVDLVRKKMPEIKLLIIGTGPLKQELINFVENGELKNNVFFSGWLATSEDVARAYSSAKIFVNPSYNEGGPRVVLEAMACGLPVITTKVGLMLDIIVDGENGLFVDWSVEDMVEKIQDLLGNKELQAKFSKAGLELVKNFERKKEIKNYADKLKELI